MAITRNHQLKVYNKFSAGEENIPADHLIEDIAFSHARDVNISDTTIRPNRTDKPTGYVLPNDTKAVIKENVKGADELLSFSKPIQFVNYADTVYYIEDTDTGSKFKQISTDGNLIKMDVIPTIDGTFDVTSGESLSDSIVAIVDKVSDEYLAFVQGTEADIVQNRGNNAVPAWGYILNNPLKGIFDEVFTNPMLSGDTPEDLKADTERLAKAKAGMDSRIAEELAVLKQDFHNVINQFTTLYDVRPLMYHGYAVPTLYSCDTNEIVLAIYNNRHSIANLLQKAISENRWMQYCIVLALKDGTSITTCGNNVDWQGCTEGYIPDSLQGDFITLEQATRQLITDLNALQNVADTDQDKINTMRGIILNNPRKFWNMVYVLGHYFAGSDSTMLTSQPAFNNIQADWVSMRNHLTIYQEELDKIDFEKDVFEKIYDFAIVAYDERNKAYSNVLRKANVYYKNSNLTVTLNPVNTDVTKYYLYRKPYTGTEFLRVKELTVNSNGTWTVQPSTFTKGGSVIPCMYQVKSQPTDFTHIAVYNGSIFLARKDSQELWFTTTGNPHCIPSTNYIKTSQPIKAIKAAGAGLFIWTNNNTLYLLKGEARDATGANTLAIQLIAQDVDIVDKHGAVSVDTLVIWLSNYSFHNTSGYGSATTTRTFWKPPIINKIIDSVIHHNVAYYLVDTPNGREVIEYDYKLKRIFHRSADDFENLAVIDGNLAVLKSDGNLYQIGAGDALSPYSVCLKRYAGYSFDTRMRFTNVTLYHTAKPYQDIPFDPTARTLVQIYIDDWLVGTEEVMGTQATRIDLPQINNTGYSIKICLQGTLGIKSVRMRYTTHDWED